MLDRDSEVEGERIETNISSSDNSINKPFGVGSELKSEQPEQNDEIYPSHVSEEFKKKFQEHLERTDLHIFD